VNLPIRAFPCKHSGHVRIALLAYRCGGSSGMAAQATHRIPVSTYGQAVSHLRPQHLRACPAMCLGKYATTLPAALLHGSYTAA